jgi:hypothetical protein
MTTATVEQKVERLDERVEWLEKINKLVTKEDFDLGIENVKEKIDNSESRLNANMGNLDNNLKASMKLMETGLRYDISTFEEGLKGEMKTLKNGLTGHMDTLDKGLRVEMVALGGRMTFLQWGIGIGFIIGFGGISVLIAIGTGMFN